MRAKFLVVLNLVLLLTALPASACASSAQAPGGVWHLVRWGETWSSIGRGYGVSAGQIAVANGLASINQIWAGT